MSDSVDNPLQAELEECRDLLNVLSATLEQHRDIIRSISKILRNDHAELCSARAHWAGAKTYMPPKSEHVRHIDMHLSQSLDYHVDIDNSLQLLADREGLACLLQQLTTHLDVVQRLANRDGTEEHDAVTSAERIAREHEDRLR